MTSALFGTAALGVFGIGGLSVAVSAIPGAATYGLSSYFLNPKTIDLNKLDKMSSAEQDKYLQKIGEQIENQNKYQKIIVKPSSIKLNGALSDFADTAIAFDKPRNEFQKIIMDHVKESRMTGIDKAKKIILERSTPLRWLRRAGKIVGIVLLIKPVIGAIAVGTMGAELCSDSANSKVPCGHAEIKFPVEQSNDTANTAPTAEQVQ